MSPSTASPIQELPNDSGRVGSTSPVRTALETGNVRSIVINVVDEQNSPLPGAHANWIVKQQRSYDRLEGFVGNTDSHGVLSAEFFEDRDTEGILVYKEGYLSATVHSPKAGYRYRVILEKAAGTTIRVLDATRGKGIAGVRLVLAESSVNDGRELPRDMLNDRIPSSTRSAALYTGISDKEGVALFPSVPAGKYVYRAFHSDYVLTDSTSQDTQFVEVPSEEITVLELYEPRVGAIWYQNDSVVTTTFSGPLRGNLTQDTELIQERLESQHPDAVVLVGPVEFLDFTTLLRRTGWRTDRVPFVLLSEFRGPTTVVDLTETPDDPNIGWLTVETVTDPGGYSWEDEDLELLVHGVEGGDYDRISIPAALSSRTSLPAGIYHLSATRRFLPALASQEIEFTIRGSQKTHVVAPVAANARKVRFRFVRSDGVHISAAIIRITDSKGEFTRIQANEDNGLFAYLREGPYTGVALIHPFGEVPMNFVVLASGTPAVQEIVVSVDE